MTQEEFFDAQDKRNEESARAYRAHLKAIEKLQKKQVEVAIKTYELLIKIATAPNTNKPKSLEAQEEK